MVAWLKVLLFVAGGATAAAGTAYVTGMLDPWLGRSPAVIAALPPETPAPEPAQPQEDTPAAAGEDVPLPDDPVTAEKQGRLVVPSFDLLRVEPDGSVLIAGKAAPEASVEVLADDTVLAGATAGADGDFVIVLDDPLAPGDYVLSLRATTAGGEVVTSSETAIVSIPESADGQVLAMVEAPGAPAELVTVPEVAAADEPAQPAEAEDIAAAGEAAGPDAAEEIAEAPEEAVAETGPDAAEEPAETRAGTEAEPAEQEVAAAPAEQEETRPQPAADARVVVEAVEIEGDTIFVAGYADPGRTVRVYAGALLLGDAVASEGGRFLVEAQRELAVGNYIIRADLLAEDGSVLARAAVPFEREPGESIAAVAAAPEPESGPEAVEEEVAAAPEPDPAPDAAEEEVAATPESEPASEAAREGDVAEEPAGSEVEIAVAEPPSQAEEEPRITAPPLQRVDEAVIIRRGDTLWHISRRVYGHGVRYSTIYLANQDQIRDPDRIWPGQVFAVPRQTAEGEEADMDAIAEQIVEPEGTSAQ